MDVVGRSLFYLLVAALLSLILARAVITWVDPYARYEASRWVHRITEPMLAPIRRLLPPTGAVDFSPVVLFLVLSIVLQAVR